MSKVVYGNKAVSDSDLNFRGFKGIKLFIICLCSVVTAYPVLGLAIYITHGGRGRAEISKVFMSYKCVMKTKPK